MDIERVVKDIIDILAKAGKFSHIPAVAEISKLVDKIDSDTDIDRLEDITEEYVLNHFKETGHIEKTEDEQTL